MATGQSLTHAVIAITDSRLDILDCGHAQACRHYTFAHPLADVVHSDVVCEYCTREQERAWPLAA